MGNITELPNEVKLIIFSKLTFESALELSQTAKVFEKLFWSEANSGLLSRYLKSDFSYALPSHALNKAPLLLRQFNWARTLYTKTRIQEAAHLSYWPAIKTLANTPPPTEIDMMAILVRAQTEYPGEGHWLFYKRAFHYIEKDKRADCAHNRLLSFYAASYAYRWAEEHGCLDHVFFEKKTADLLKEIEKYQLCSLHDIQSIVNKRSEIERGDFEAFKLSLHDKFSKYIAINLSSIKRINSNTMS